MQDALILSGYLVAIIAVFFFGWMLCTAGVAAKAMLFGEDVSKAIKPWLEEL